MTKHILLALQRESTAKLYFNQKLAACDLEEKTVTFENVNWIGEYAHRTKPTDDRDVETTSVTESTRMMTVPFNFLIGCDGAYSNVRQHMMKKMDMNLEVSYIHAKWCDLMIPPSSDGSYRMDSHNLHVWPDKDSIVMAQPDCVCLLSDLTS